MGPSKSAGALGWLVFLPHVSRHCLWKHAGLHSPARIQTKTRTTFSFTKRTLLCITPHQDARKRKRKMKTTCFPSSENAAVLGVARETGSASQQFREAYS